MNGPREPTETVQGSPCKRGHAGLRYLKKNGKPGACAGCMKARNAKWYRENLEAAKAYRAKYRRENLESEKARQAKYRRENPEAVKARRAKWHRENQESERARAAKYRRDNAGAVKARDAKYRRDNAETVKARSAKYCRENPEKVCALKAKRRAAKLQRTPRWADLKAIEAIYWVCAQLQKETGGRFDIDHVVPLQGRNVSGLHVHYNLQIIPHVANTRKRNRFSDESKDQLDRAHRAARNNIVGRRIVPLTDEPACPRLALAA